MDWLNLAHEVRSLWTVWLVLLFGAVAIYALWPRNKKHFEDCSRIPFRDEMEDQVRE